MTWWGRTASQIREGKLLPFAFPYPKLSTAQISEKQNMDRNKHVKEFLRYYAGLEVPPKYAVMLNGQWGIGKTHLIEEFISKTKSDDYSIALVSLSGLNSHAEIDKALFRSMHRFMGNKFFEAALRIGNSGLKAAKGFSIDINPLDYFDRYKANLFVFDDLERCALPISHVLGYINAFVEQGKCKVVIIANQEKFDEDLEYADIKEKVVGKTLLVQSTFPIAIPKFLDSIKSQPANIFLASKVNDIEALYEQSNLHNLRIIQQTMWDFERFYDCLDRKHQANDVAMTAILRMLFALSFEFKAGHIKEDDLLNRRDRLVKSLMPSQSKVPVSPLQKARRLYLNADLDSNALSDETLIALIVKGIADADRIRRDLDASSYFVTVADEPEWRTVAYAYSRTEAEFDSALERMEAAFVNRAYEKVGVILHVFGQRLWLTKIGVLPDSLHDRVVEGKRYLDDLAEAKRLEPSYRDIMVGHLHSFEGINIEQIETPEFAELLAFLNEKRRQGEVDRYPVLATGLLESMVNEPDKFFEMIVMIPGKRNEVAYLPVFAAIDPDIFIDRFLKLHPSHQREVLTAFEARYDKGLIRGDLVDEAPWIRDVRDKIFKATEGMSPIGRERIRTLLKNSIDEVINEPAIHDHGLNFVDPDFDA